MALVEEDAVDDALDGLVERGVLEDDVRGLAAEFQRQFLAGAGDLALDGLADLGGAGEGDLVDAGMLTSAAPRAAPVTMLTTPGGSPASRQTRRSGAR